MIRKSSEDRERSKQMLRGLEQLVELGGFIQEQIEEEIYQLYPKYLILKMKKYYPLGPGFWEVADVVEGAVKKLGKYSDYILEYDISDFIESEFIEWLVDQIARLEVERVKSGNGNFWKKWELKMEAKRALMKLNVLEERVLYLSAGLDGKEKLNASQIANLPEFQCSVNYIKIIMKVIEQTMRRCNWGREEFYRMCNAYRTR